MARRSILRRVVSVNAQSEARDSICFPLRRGEHVRRTFLRTKDTALGETRETRDRIPASKRLRLTLLVNSAILVALTVCPSAVYAKERLVPAKWTAKNSGGGTIWTCDTHGRTHVNNNYLLSNMNVNGQQFQPSQPPMMTPDGSEYVLRGRCGALKVERRLKVHPKLRGARVVDRITNPTKAPMKVTHNVMGHLSVRPASVRTSSGQSGSRQLSPKDVGVYAKVQGNINGHVFWFLRTSKSSVKPFFRTNNNNQSLNFSYTVTIQPGRTVGIMLGARFVPQPTMKKDKVAREFRQYGSTRWTRDLPRTVRKSLLNMGRGGWGAFGDGGLTQPIETEIGLSPTNFDVLALGPQTLVQGKAACGRLAVSTDHGTVEVPMKDVAAIVGNRNAALSPRVYLRDGQRLLGDLTAEDLRFDMTSGATVDLSIDRLDRLIMTKSPDKAGGPSLLDPEGASDDQDPKESWLVMTRAGLVLRSMKTTGALGIATSWGPLNLPLEDIRMIRPLDDEFPGYMVQLRDGTRLRAFLRASTLALENELLGKIALKGHELRALQYEEPVTRDQTEESSFHRDDTGGDENDASMRPHAILSGGDVILGRIDLDTLHFRAAGETLPVSPSQLRIMRNAEEGDPEDPLFVAQFQAEIWGGGQIFGTLEEVILPFETDRGRMMIPVRDIVEVHVPTPVIPDALLARLTKTIQDLGHSRWERREAAYVKLQEMGDVARLPMEQALRLTKDPEVERRLRRLLQEVGDDR